MNRFDEAWLNQMKQLFECQDKILGITKSKTKSKTVDDYGLIVQTADDKTIVHEAENRDEIDRVLDRYMQRKESIHEIIIIRGDSNVVFEWTKEEEKWQAAKLEEHEEADSYQRDRENVVELKTWRK